MLEALKLKGSMEVILTKPDGTQETRFKDNLIVDAGWDFICDAIAHDSSRPGIMSHIAVGTSNTAVAGNQTALGTELDRKAATYSHTSGTKVFQMETTFNAGEATGAITEAGVFNASSNGIMLDRVVFAVLNKGADDVITQRFTFTFT